MDIIINGIETAVKNNLRYKTHKITTNAGGSTFQSKNFIPRGVRSLYKSKVRLSLNLRKAKCLTKVLTVKNKIVEAE